MTVILQGVVCCVGQEKVLHIYIYVRIKGLPRKRKERVKKDIRQNSLFTTFGGGFYLESTPPFLPIIKNSAYMGIGRPKPKVKRDKGYVEEQPKNFCPVRRPTKKKKVESFALLFLLYYMSFAFNIPQGYIYLAQYKTIRKEKEKRFFYFSLLYSTTLVGLYNIGDWALFGKRS